jgi:hypothetical protein
MEGFPSFLVLFNICAAAYPRFASVAGLVWAVGRVMYQNGYGSIGPKGRGTGTRISGYAVLTLVTSQNKLSDSKLFGSIFGLCSEYAAFM